MTIQVRFRAKAEQDVLKAAQYYQSASPSLGLKFLDRIEDVVNLIQRNPEMFPICFTSFRRALLKQFPFALYYELNDRMLMVVAVIHQQLNFTKADISRRNDP